MDKWERYEAYKGQVEKLGLSGVQYAVVISIIAELLGV